jgi:hypothetical protein
MVTKIVVHFGEDGGNTVAISPNKGVRGVLFHGPLGVLDDLRTDQREKLDGKVEAKVKGNAMEFSQIHEQIGACYWVEGEDGDQIICW